MKKILVLLPVVIVIAVVLLIPFSTQRTVVIKAPFLKTYGTLIDPGSWPRWQPAIRKIFLEDSQKVAVRRLKSSFKISAPHAQLLVMPAANVFGVTELDGAGSKSCTYLVSPSADLNSTAFSVSYNGNLWDKISGKAASVDFINSRIDAFKRYMETDSLYYGYNFVKIPVPSGKLIVVREEVLKADKFTRAAALFATLKNYVKARHLRVVQPVIAQFMAKSADSIQVNVGLFIDSEVKTTGNITFVRMPDHGRLLTVHYTGRFDQRGRAYLATHRYFQDKQYQDAIAPFETYLDNKLPTSDTEQVNIQINFSTFL